MQALSLGHALDVQSAGAGAIHSVFAHAVNVEIRGDLWTLLGAERADLPFGVRVASQDFDALGLRRGDRVDVRAGFVGIESGRAGVVVDCRAAPRWIASLQDELAPGLVERLRVVAVAAAHRAWPGSGRIASAVMAALRDPAALRSVLPRVVGCGPGSTPAGDDVLVGILAVLTSPCSGATGAGAGESLRRSLHPLLPATTEISAHLLRQAADGLFGRAVHELVCALIGDSAPRQLSEAVQRVIDTGATSGADMCVGLLAAARSFLLTCDKKAAA